MGKRLGVSEDYLATGAERADESAAMVEAELALRLDEREVARELYEKALERAGPGLERARALAGLGQLAFQEGKPREAARRLEEAQRLWKGDLQDQPAVAETLGRAYAALDQLDTAVEVFQTSLESAERRKDPVETIRFAVLLANAYIDRTEFAAAEQLLERILELAPDAKDPIFGARVYWSQSRLHAMQEDHIRAARYARKALNLLELTEHTHYAAQAHQLLAHIELDRKRPEEALELLQKGLGLLGESGSPVDVALFKLEEARALIQLGRNEEAASLAMEATGLLAEGSPQDAGRGYAIVAEVFEQLGQPAKARELYELAVEKLGDTRTHYLFDVYQKLAALLEAEGENDEALHVLKRAVALQSAGSQ